MEKPYLYDLLIKLVTSEEEREKLIEKYFYLPGFDHNEIIKCLSVLTAEAIIPIHYRIRIVREIISCVKYYAQEGKRRYWMGKIKSYAEIIKSFDAIDEIKIAFKLAKGNLYERFFFYQLLTNMKIFVDLEPEEWQKLRF